jgi:hypothetical protein
VAAVHAGDVPPTVDIESPRWYQLADPTVQDALRVEADVAARRSSSYTYEVQYGLGPQPLESEFVTFARGSGTSAQRITADLDLSRIPESFWRGQYETTPDRLSIERYDVTVRVQVVDAQGGSARTARRAWCGTTTASCRASRSSSARAWSRRRPLRTSTATARSRSSSPAATAWCTSCAPTGRRCPASRSAPGPRPASTAATA